MALKWKHQSSGFISCSVFLIFAICATFPKTMGSITVDINEDFHHDDDINPCDLASSEKPSGYCYCTPEDPNEAFDVRCGFITNPSKKEWQSIALLRTATSIQIVNRPAGSIREVPPPYVFTGMKNLHYFTMKMAALSNVPSFAFGNSSGVAELDVQDNSIYELSPYSFSNLINLTKINLSENNLTEISRNVFVNLPRLKVMVLMKNGIQVIHDFAFKELKSLEDLELQNNRLSVVTREVFSGLIKLRNLDLQDNLIEYLGDHVFAEMPRLHDLDLHGNKIVSVSASAFAGLRLLTRLNLKDNKIVKFHPETFNHLNKIHFIDIRSNELETLNHALMKPIYKNLKNMNMQLLVEENRFVCDCRILWIKTLHEETASNYVKNHLSGTTCNLFESTHKHVSASSFSSPSYSNSEGVYSDITLLTSPPEDTTTYAVEKVMLIVNLTEKDFNCGNEADLKNHDVDIPVHENSYHHQPPRGVGDGHKQTILYPSSWDTKGDSHQRDSQDSGITSEGMLLGVDQNSILNEPQATAALEGTDVIGSAPQSTSSADQKVDTSRITQSPSSSTSKLRICDFSALLFSIVVAIALN